MHPTVKEREEFAGDVTLCRGFKVPSIDRSRGMSIGQAERGECEEAMNLS